MSIIMTNGKVITTSNGASICNINDDCYVNGVKIPNEDGEYNIKGTRVTVKHTKNNNINIGKNLFDGSSIQINNSKNDKSNDNIQKSGKDYIISSIGEKIRKNIIVNGDIIISGMNNKVKFGKEKIDRETIEVKGDFIISGMNVNVGNIVQHNGDIVNSGLNNKIVK